ncbi:uncharacterized protein LOC129958343 [Argiope bruennichi]|uniref:uncharacterized protein LOC129958343 n=1 Tax=Argiope bruennichi TaxID=94029 RepID=UPI00249536BE|nr:uncharacterized protein LOC129958343 [Argiope bruennichi]
MDSSENDITSLARVTEDGSRKPTKRLGSWYREITSKKTRPEKIMDNEEEFHDDLTDDKLHQQSLESTDNNSQLLLRGSLSSFQNSLDSASDTTIRNFPRGSEKRVLNPDILCLSMKKLKLCEFEPLKLTQDNGSFVADQQLISKAESSPLEKSENVCAAEDPTIFDTCASDSSTDLISLGNGLQSDLVTLPDESNQIKSAGNKDQLCSIENSDENLKEKSNFNANDDLSVLFGLVDNDEHEELSCEESIFCSNLHVDVFSEDEVIFRALRNVFKKKLKNFTNQTETLDIHQTSDKDEFKNHSKQYSQDCAELDIFEDRSKNTCLNSNSTSEAQCQELKTTKEHVACPPMSSTNGTKEKKCTINFPSSVSFNEKVKEQLHVDKITKAVECSKSCSSGKEGGSKRSSDDSKEMEEIPSLLSFIQKSGPETMIKRLTKNRKINLLEASQLPSFKKSVSIDSPTDHIFPMDMENIMKLFETAPAESKISGSANNSTNGTK